MTLNAILVEDSKTIRDSLIPTMAELAGIDVIAVAETATQAMDALVQHADEWQLAIVDLFLRQGSGLEVVRACQQRRRNQKVVVLTNYATPDIRRNCLGLGSDAVFDKSTELDDFFEFCISLADK